MFTWPGKKYLWCMDRQRLLIVRINLSQDMSPFFLRLFSLAPQLLRARDSSSVRSFLSPADAETETEAPVLAELFPSLSLEPFCETKNQLFSAERRS